MHCLYSYEPKSLKYLKKKGIGMFVDNCMQTVTI